MNRCVCGRSASCWGRTRSTTWGTRLASWPCRSSSLTERVMSRQPPGFFLVAKFLPRAVRGRADRPSGPVVAAARAADDLRRSRRSCSRALGFRGDRGPLLPAAHPAARPRRRDAGDHGTRAHARRHRGDPTAHGADRRGQRADEPRVRGVLGVRRGDRRRASIAAFGVSGGAVRATPASFLIIARAAGRARGPPSVDALTRTSRGRTRFRGGLSFARSHPLIRTLLVGQSLALICFTVVVPIEVIYAEGVARHHERRLRPAAERAGAPASCSAACSTSGSSNRSGFGLVIVSSALVGARLPGHVPGGRAAGSRARCPWSAAPATASSGWRR